MKKKLINVAKYALGLALGGLFLYLAFQGANWEEIAKTVRDIDPGWLLLSLSVGLFSHYIRGVRWQMQLKASGYQPGYLNLFAAVMVGYLVNQVLPRAGEVARCTSLLRSDKVPLSTGFGTVVIERVFDLLILVVLIGLAFVLESETIFKYLDQFAATQEGGDSSPVLWILGGTLLGGAVLLWALRKPLLKLPLVQKAVNFGRELIQSALSIRHIERPWLFIFYTFTIWFCYWMMTYCCFFAIDEFWQLEINLFYLSLVTTVMGGIGMAIPVPGGTGPYHAAVTFTFVALMVAGGEEASRQLGQTFAIIMHSAQVVMMVGAGLLGYAYLLTQKPRNSALHPESQPMPSEEIGSGV